MAGFEFERECRTPSSECYAIVEEDVALGRVDLHFTQGIVHGTINVSESLTIEAIRELIESIDQQIIDAAGIARDEVIMHVHQGRDLGRLDQHQPDQLIPLMLFGHYLFPQLSMLSASIHCHIQ